MWLSAPAPLHDHALVADGQRGALIGPLGDLVWMCFPGWADAPLFAGLHLGPGTYVVQPACPAVASGYYEPGTLIWRSRWATHDGIAECANALVRPAPESGAVFLRQLRAMDHGVRFSVRFAPAPRLSAARLHFRRVSPGCYEASAGGVYLRWSGVQGARRAGAGLHLELEVKPGRTHDLMLELSTQPFRDPPLPAAALWARTRDDWKAWVHPMPMLAAPQEARLAAAVLYGLTPSDGGMVAAVTTSLPERAQTGRSYDYRYCWIRDQCYAGLAAASSGMPLLLDRAVRFVAERVLADGPNLHPAYTSDGKRVPEEESLPLAGYPGSVEVRRGNAAGKQYQLDIFGEALLLFAAAARQDRLDRRARSAALVAAHAIEKRWPQPDGGVWELPPAHHTHSWLVSAAGLRQLADVERSKARRRHFLQLADRLVVHARAHATRRDGAWMRAAGDERADAALLIPAVRGAFAGREPRTAATLRAVERELTREGLVFRFRHDERPLGSAEGAFLICQFWLALAYLEQGRLTDAVRAFERGRSAAGEPGLYTEEFDVEQRQNRGNLPQAFVHAALLETAARLAHTRR